MKLDLTSTKINQLLGRKELAFRIDENSTPKRADVRKEIAVLMRTDLDNVVVRVLDTRSGTRVTTGVAHVYTSKEAAEKVESPHIIARNTGKAKEPKKEEASQ